MECQSSLPENKIAPGNGWLEYQFPFADRPIFRREVLVLGSAFSNESWLFNDGIFITVYEIIPA